MGRRVARMASRAAAPGVALRGAVHSRRLINAHTYSLTPSQHFTPVVRILSESRELPDSHTQDFGHVSNGRRWSQPTAVCASFGSRRRLGFRVVCELAL